ncbi:hypothetical protein WICPIJ_004599 [Wickerhamomyces pijperi]|uniref:Uncharacterized protein n=1 Tax=Wickerhamomyces pijperi TaxID=599730 RepID=A0A9P8Q5D2_WICPI|nr:hypothetical protein WICPIJ_004599 [Wickerhamomyces pijperi]
MAGMLKLNDCLDLIKVESLNMFTGDSSGSMVLISDKSTFFSGFVLFVWCWYSWLILLLVMYFWDNWFNTLGKISLNRSLMSVSIFFWTKFSTISTFWKDDSTLMFSNGSFLNTNVNPLVLENTMIMIPENSICESLMSKGTLKDSLASLNFGNAKSCVWSPISRISSSGAMSPKFKSLMSILEVRKLDLVFEFKASFNNSFDHDSMDFLSKSHLISQDMTVWLMMLRGWDINK